MLGKLALVLRFFKKNIYYEMIVIDSQATFLGPQNITWQ